MSLNFDALIKAFASLNVAIQRAKKEPKDL
jgi:hypothetical protein